MSPAKSSSPAVAELLALNNANLQRLVLKVMRGSGRKSMARTTVVAEIARHKGVKQLKGSMREQFQKNVNFAIGALLNNKPPRLIKVGPNNTTVALPNGKSNAPKRARTQLLAAVRERITLLRFTCIECGREVEVTEFDQKGWCDCLTPFF